MFRPWRSFPFMVAAGLVVGLITGGYPAYVREIAQAALVVAMVFSLTEISFARISPRAELRGLLLALGMSYGLLSGLLLLFASLSPEPSIHDGWVLMAAMPPAVAVIPITSFLRGDTRRALFSAAMLYVMGLVLVPLISIVFAGRTLPVTDLVFQTLFLIGAPLLVSRPLRKMEGIVDVRPTAVAVAFFFLVVAIAGSTRDTLLGNPDLVATLSLLSLLRTFGLGVLLLLVTRALRVPRDNQVAATTFASFKNLGIAVVLAFSFFGAEAALPSVVSLVFEILWLGALPIFFRTPPTALRHPGTADPSGRRGERRGEDQKRREVAARANRLRQVRTDVLRRVPDVGTVPVTAPTFSQEAPLSPNSTLAYLSISVGRRVRKVPALQGGPSKMGTTSGPGHFGSFAHAHRTRGWTRMQSKTHFHRCNRRLY